MKKLLFSGFESLDKSEIHPLFFKVHEMRERWAKDNGWDYIFNTTDVLSKFDTSEYRFSEKKTKRSGATIVDITRILWIKEFLKEYDSVTWLDCDVFLYKNFNIPENNHPHPTVIRDINIYARLINFDEKSFSRRPVKGGRSNGILTLTRSHLKYIDFYLNMCKLISVECSEDNFKEEFHKILSEYLPNFDESTFLKVHQSIWKKKSEYDWMIYGTHFKTAMNQLIDYHIYEGLSFISLLNTDYMLEDDKYVDIFFKMYNNIWGFYGTDTTVSNFGCRAKKELDNIEKLHDKFKENGFLY